MSDTNAKDEFIKHVKDRKILCAKVSHGSECEEYGTKFLLKQGYTGTEYRSFLRKLDFDYDSGFGGQELYGLIWYTDGTWSSRGEYDGSEWWDYKRVPDVPEELK